MQRDKTAPHTAPAAAVKTLSTIVVLHAAWCNCLVVSHAEWCNCTAFVVSIVSSGSVCVCVCVCVCVVACMR